jgi:hypothetical protein
MTDKVRSIRPTLGDTVKNHTTPESSLIVLVIDDDGLAIISELTDAEIMAYLEIAKMVTARGIIDY